MLISDFDYDLPDELIAQVPLTERAASRMLVVNRSANSYADNYFASIGELLRAGDTLVLNNTKVFPARLVGTTETGAAVEIFLVREIQAGTWETLGRPAKRMRVGKRIVFGEGLSCEVLMNADGRLTVRFTADGDLPALIERFGKTPLPPYIKREISSPDSDRERYQTVFAKNRGAIAAPTAGLHFTPELLSELRKKGVEICEITLHVGYGTFEPVRTADLSKHRVLPEEYEIDEPTSSTLNQALAEKRRIIAVGTTTTRALEAALEQNGEFSPVRAFADLTITPGYNFKAIDGLLTNFHLPQSSLLVLISSYAGHELTMRAYGHAVASRYRFFSYGDCMLIL